LAIPLLKFAGATVVHPALPLKRQTLSIHMGTQTDQPEVRGTYAEKAIYILKSVDEFRQHFLYKVGMKH
jgi:hypothetical protein